MSLYVFRSSKMHTAAFRGRGCHALCVRTHLHHLFSCFWQHLCLLVSCFFLFFLNNLTSVQKRCVRHKRLFFSNKINFRRHEISFFHLLFSLSKLAKTLLILIKLNVRYTLYFSMIPYFGKTLYSVGRK